VNNQHEISYELENTAKLLDILKNLDESKPTLSGSGGSMTKKRRESDSRTAYKSNIERTLSGGGGVVLKEKNPLMGISPSTLNVLSDNAHGIESRLN
jgi:hypothetical protein